MNIRTKLVMTFALCGIVPLLIAGVVLYTTTMKNMESLQNSGVAQLESKVSNALIAQRSIKANNVKDYFGQIQDQAITFTQNLMVIDAMQSFASAYDSYIDERGLSTEALAEQKRALWSYYAQDFTLEFAAHNDATADMATYFDHLSPAAIALQHTFIHANPHPLGSKHELSELPADDSAYAAAHERFHPSVNSYLQSFGFYDIFLVEPRNGTIVYSVFKELDYGTSLIDGPVAQSNLGRAFRAANRMSSPDDCALVDFEAYLPSYNAPASFIASPIFDGDTKVGIAIFQMPVSRITALMADRAGLGESGETILVGPDMRMRSNS
ncbi:MAG: methyl-accepting chemotaxis protein, partial [Planctomycetota bacterium]